MELISPMVTIAKNLSKNEVEKEEFYKKEYVAKEKYLGSEMIESSNCMKRIKTPYNQERKT